MKRFRWFGVDWPVSVRTIGKRLKLHSFGDQAQHGFVVDRVRDDYLEARYVEQVEYKDVVIDPFGNELQFDRLEYRQTKFVVSEAQPGLELIDAPRNVGALMNRLSEVADFAIAINPLAVDVLLWAKRFKKVSSSSFLIGSLQIGALEMEPEVHAKVVLKGGKSKDVQDACNELINGRSHVIEKVQLNLTLPVKGMLVLSSTGSVTFSSESLVAPLLGSLRTSLSETAKERAVALRKNANLPKMQ